MPDKLLRMALALILAALPGAALAELTLISDMGDEYDVASNENGAVLTSLYPKAWPHLEPDQDHVTVREKAVVYLGRDCDALHSAWGKGVWEEDNGGFTAAFRAGTLRFSRQEIVIEASDCLWLPSDGDWPPPGAFDE